MTVLVANKMNKYIGLSTDEKPLNVREGSTYHSVDTGEHWIFHDKLWETDLTMARAMKDSLEI